MQQASVQVAAEFYLITPKCQMKAERAAELTLVGILLGLPFDNHIRQSLTVNVLAQRVSRRRGAFASRLLHGKRDVR